MSGDRFGELVPLVDRARAMTEELRKQYPLYPPYVQLANDLERIANHVAARRVPDAQAKSDLDFGLWAVKELEADEPEYARLLMRVSSIFKNL